jgi:hypothetical protein
MSPLINSKNFANNKAIIINFTRSNGTRTSSIIDLIQCLNSLNDSLTDTFVVFDIIERRYKTIKVSNIITVMDTSGKQLDIKKLHDRYDDDEDDDAMDEDEDSSSDYIDNDDDESDIEYECDSGIEYFVNECDCDSDSDFIVDSDSEFECDCDSESECDCDCDSDSDFIIDSDSESECDCDSDSDFDDEVEIEYIDVLINDKDIIASRVINNKRKCLNLNNGWNVSTLRPRKTRRLTYNN